MGHMDPDHDLPIDTEEVRRALRDGGARFAFVHGSRASGTSRTGSDVDVAAWFGRHDPMHDLEVASRMPARVDLSVLDTFQDVDGEALLADEVRLGSSSTRS